MSEQDRLEDQRRREVERQQDIERARRQRELETGPDRDYRRPDERQKR